MRVRRSFVLVLFAVILAGSGAMAAPPVSSGSQVIIPGEPPITLDVIHDHLRLMEFVLQMRLTQSQKAHFLQAVKDECDGMEKADRENFVQANDLVHSMATMDDNGRETVRRVLAADFDESAKADESDPAAQLYIVLQGEAKKPVFGTERENMSMQGLMAFIEYLGFTVNPASPAVLLPAEKDEVKKVLAAGMAKFPEPVRKSLTQFDQTWHLIRAGWLGAGDEQKTRWAAALGQPWGGLASPTFEEKTVTGALLPEVWTEMASVAATLGETGGGWTATPTIRVW